MSGLMMAPPMQGPQMSLPQFAIGPDGNLKLLTQDQVVNFFNDIAKKSQSPEKTGNAANMNIQASKGSIN